MYCPFCGAWIADGDKVCPQCRQLIEAAPQQPAQEPWRQEQPAQQSQQNAWQSASPTGNVNPAAGAGQTQPKLGWFKFLINFALFAGALISLYNGISQMTGMVYSGSGATAQEVYQVFSGLKTLDLITGILFIGIAVLSVVTRFRLAKFRQDGPSFLYLLYGANLGVNILYLLLASVLTGLELLSAEVVGQLAGSAVMLAVNIIYFTKRKALFVN